MSSKLHRLDIVAGGFMALLAFVLAAAVLSSLRTTEHALEAVDRGAAVSMSTEVQRALRGQRGRPNSERLQTVLTSLHDKGLRYLSIGPEAARRVEAGDSKLSFKNETTDLARGSGRILLKVRLPPPERGPRGGHPERGRPPHEGPPGEGRRRPGGRERGPPVLTMEMQSAVSEGLLQDAQRATGVGILAGLLLLVLGPFMVRLLRRGRQLEAQRGAEQELIALGRMAAVVAHEIRNPLASLKGHAQLLQERLAEPRDRKKIERVVAEAIRLEELMRGLLDFLRSQRVEPQATDLNILVQSVLEELSATDRVITKTQGAPATWPLDPDRMRQVLSNIIDNALEVSGSEPPELTITGDAKELQIRLRDRGPGLPQDQDIFAPFMTTKTHGTGLGLAVSQSIVGAHHGTIEAHDRANGGTEICIRLPRA